MVGVNKHRLAQDETPIDILKVDNTAVRDRSRSPSSKKLRAERDQAATDAALNKLANAADDKSANLLALAVDAARAKATVGEISDALEKPTAGTRPSSAPSAASTPARPRWSLPQAIRPCRTS